MWMNVPILYFKFCIVNVTIMTYICSKLFVYMYLITFFFFQIQLFILLNTVIFKFSIPKIYMKNV